MLARLVIGHIIATGGVALTDDLLGQFLGQEQSGFADQLRVVDLTDIDPRLLEDVGGEVDRLMAVDPELERPEHAGLRAAVDELWRRYAQV